MRIVDPAGFCDRQVPVLSTLGRGPKGEKGDTGDTVYPTFSDEPWSIDIAYRKLTVVLHEGNSYTAKQDVPVGISIYNTDFWAETGDYNQQIEDAISLMDGVVIAFDTVERMQEATNLKPGMICHTNGFHEPGDNGAAYYHISADEDPNEMDVISLSNGLYAVFANAESYVTPEMFGAIGDGINDDSDCLEKCSSYSNPILLQNEYLISRIVVLHNSIFGDGLGKIILPNVQDAYLYVGLTNAIIDGISFESNSKNGYTLYLAQSNNTVSNCVFYNSGVAIRSIAGVNIHHCYLHNVTTGIYVSSTNEYIDINNIKIENDSDYRLDLFEQLGKSGILLEATTSVANISDIYMSNVLENFIYAQAKSVTISDCMLVNGLVVKVVGFDDTMAEFASVSNVTFIDTDDTRHTGNLFHVQIYTCIDTIYDSISYVGSKSRQLFNISRECTNIVIKNVSCSLVSQFAVINNADIENIDLENIYVKYSSVPVNTGILNIADSTIENINMNNVEYVIDVISGSSNRFFYRFSNSTVGNINVIGKTNEPFYNPLLIDGSHNIEILTNAFTLISIFTLYNNIKGKNFVIRYEGITLSANSLNTSGNVFNLVIARYRSIGVNQNVNARIIVYADNDTQEYSLIGGLLTKLSGSNTYITQANSGDNILLRGDVKSFNMDVKITN